MTIPSPRLALAGRALASLMALAGLGACASMSDRDRNTAIGAAVGAAAGSVLTGGSTTGTLGGAVIGGVIGNKSTEKADEGRDDRKRSGSRGRDSRHERDRHD